MWIVKMRGGRGIRASAKENRDKQIRKNWSASNCNSVGATVAAATWYGRKPAAHVFAYTATSLLTSD